MSVEDQASPAQSKKGFFLIGLGWDHGVTEDFETLEDAIAAVAGFRSAPATLPSISEDEYFWIAELAHQIDTGMVPTRYQNHGPDRSFYVMRNGWIYDHEPDEPSVVVHV